MTDFFHGLPYKIICWSLFVLWFAVLNVLSSIPMPEMPPGIDLNLGDKVAHFLIFGAGAFLLATAWSASRPGVPFARFAFVFMIISTLGIADEFRQLFVPGRSGADPGDMLANLAGSIIGALFAYILHRHFLPERKPER